MLNKERSSNPSAWEAREVGHTVTLRRLGKVGQEDRVQGDWIDRTDCVGYCSYHMAIPNYLITRSYLVPTPLPDFGGR